MNIPLFSFDGAFTLKKGLRPGLFIGDTMAVLTHTKPYNKSWVAIPAKCIRSPHFNARSDTVYLTKPDSNHCKRFNNAIGGTLSVTPQLMFKLSEFFQVPLEDIQLHSIKVIMKITFAQLQNFLPASQEEMGIADNDRVKDISTGAELSIEQLHTKLMALDSATRAKEWPEFDTLFKVAEWKYRLQEIGAFDAAAIANINQENLQEVAVATMALEGKNPLEDKDAEKAFSALEETLGATGSIDQYATMTEEDLKTTDETAGETEVKADEETLTETEGGDAATTDGTPAVEPEPEIDTNMPAVAPPPAETAVILASKPGMTPSQAKFVRTGTATLANMARNMAEFADSLAEVANEVPEEETGA